MSSNDLYPEAKYLLRKIHKIVKKIPAVESFDSKVTCLQPTLAKYSYTGFPGMYRNSLKQSRDSFTLGYS